MQHNTVKTLVVNYFNSSASNSHINKQVNFAEEKYLLENCPYSIIAKKRAANITSILIRLKFIILYRYESNICSVFISKYLLKNTRYKKPKKKSSPLIQEESDQNLHPTLRVN